LNSESTVYLVDDDPAMLRALTVLVKLVFPRVEAFTSAADFLAAYRKDQPGCLVLDVEMPGISGIELMRKLVQDKITLPVVFVSGCGNIAVAVEAMRLGAVDFLEKPVGDQALWGSIRKALLLDGQLHLRRANRCRAEQRLARLTPREHEVVHLVLAGKLNREIARELGLSPRAVEDRRARALTKMGANSLVDLMQLMMTC
jgi:two-component system, LuxR family, response regulator FixJ